MPDSKVPWEEALGLMEDPKAWLAWDTWEARG